MEATPQHLEPRAPSERVVFGQSVEALLKSCGPRPAPEHLKAFADAGINLLKRIPVAIPYDQYLDLMYRLAQARFPEAEGEHRFFLLGQAFLEGYRETMMGRALLKLIAVLGPKRMLLQCTRSFRSANNYSEAKATELGPNHFDLAITPVRHPGWFHGILVNGLQIAGAKNPRLEQKSHVGDEVIFDVRWD